VTNKVETIIPVNYEDEMQKSFIDYAMSVIVSRAIPDVRDGLKPVHRRILHAMNELGLEPSKQHRKSARIVGDVLGKYHPHGDASVYDAMVRMAQDFRLMMPLVDGHGNFGSIDGDSAAAMRYTEARLSPISMEILTDIDKRVIDFQDNYDGTAREPVVMPARLPNLLVNGTSGIAVGMRTEMPPHNLREVAKALIAWLDNPHLSVAQLMKYIKGPDFPTGGIIVNESDIKTIYETGTGNLRIRAKIEREQAARGKTLLVVTEVPYPHAGSKQKLIEKLLEMVKDKKLEEVSDLRDESSKDGIRIVIEVKKGIDIDAFIVKLYKKTPLEVSYSINLLALQDRKPHVFTLPELMASYVEFQINILTKKYQYLLEKATERQEIITGLIKASTVMDTLLVVLRNSQDVAMAKDCMINGEIRGIPFPNKKIEKEAEKFRFTPLQSQSILEMRLQRLVKLEQTKLQLELNELVTKINDYMQILNDPNVMKEEMKNYLKEISKKYGFDRKTEIASLSLAIPTTSSSPTSTSKTFVIGMDEAGYIKKSENMRKSSANSLEVGEDGKLAIFTNDGKLNWIKVNEIPNGTAKDKGTPVDTLIKSKPEEVLLSTLSVIGDDGEKTWLLTTKNGMMKRCKVKDMNTSRLSVSVMGLEEGDELIDAIAIEDIDEVGILSTQFQKVISVSDIAIQGRTAKGVRVIPNKESECIIQVFHWEQGKPLEDWAAIPLVKRGHSGTKRIDH
jgi:DNA gyrase subunit A